MSSFRLLHLLSFGDPTTNTVLINNLLVQRICFVWRNVFKVTDPIYHSEDIKTFLATHRATLLAETIKFRWYVIMTQHVLPVQGQLGIDESTYIHNQWVSWIGTKRSETIKVRLEIIFKVKAIFSQQVVSKRCSQHIKESPYKLFVAAMESLVVLQSRPDYQRCQFVGNNESICFERGVTIISIRYMGQGDIGTFKIKARSSIGISKRLIWVIEPMNFGIKRLYSLP
jgi:hypothetical protein